MGTEAGTILTINNIDENVDLVDIDEGALGSNAFNQLNDIIVNLNRGDTYTLAAIATGGGDVPDAFEYNPNHTYNGDGLIGARITSSKPVVVNSGSMTGAFTEGGGGLKDYGFDQLVDQSKVGKKYIFKKGDGGNTTENVLLVGTTNNTSITINGTPVTTATRGARYLKSISVSAFEGDGVTGNPLLTTTNITAGEYFLIEVDISITEE